MTTTPDHETRSIYNWPAFPLARAGCHGYVASTDQFIYGDLYFLGAAALFRVTLVSANPYMSVIHFRCDAPALWFDVQRAEAVACISTLIAASYSFDFEGVPCPR